MQAVYASVLFLLSPFLRVYLGYRAWRGKEEKNRLGERRGITKTVRPPGDIIWCHAASVGETVALLPMIKALLARNTQLHILLTSGTVTAHRVLRDKLPERVIHQYSPLDVVQWVRRFLSHWQPSAAIMVESEIWPNLILETHKRAIPLIQLNARISPQSFNLWGHAPRWIKMIMACFCLSLVQSDEDAERLAALGALHIQKIGNIKFSAEPLAYDSAILHDVKTTIGTRPVWLMASTQPGEEQLAVRVHKMIIKKIPDMLTIIVPRHPQRAPAIAAMLQDAQISFAQRSKGELPGPQTALYLADTMGELGLFYALCDLVCVGGSFVPIGGHNIIEPAQLHCAIFFGPFMNAAPDVRDAFLMQDAAEQVPSYEHLAESLVRFHGHLDAVQQRQQAAYAVVQRHAHVIDDVLLALSPYIPKAMA